MRISLQDPGDLNYLRKLMAAGALSDEDLSAATLSGHMGGTPPPQNALAAALAAPTAAPPSDQQLYDPASFDPAQPDSPIPMNSMRNNETGKMTYFKPAGMPPSAPGFSDTPYPAMPNPSMGGAGGPQVMPTGAAGKMRVIGAGNGQTVDLGLQPATPPALDYTRGMVDIPGVGRGYYGKDGNAYVSNPDGSMTKAILGYDMAGSMALNKNTLGMQKEQADIAHTQEQIRASRINNPDFSGGGAGGPSSGLTGQDFLKTLDPMTAQQVQAYAEGRIPLPAGFALKAPYFQNMLRMLGQYDPSFDVANAPTRVATRKSFTSGPDSANVTAIETAINHLGGLYDAYGQLDNTRAPMWNAVANAAENTGLLPGSEKNQTATGAVQSHALAVAHELASVFRRTGMSNKEVDDWLNQISTSAAPASSNSVISNAIDLLNGRLGPLADKYNTGMGTTKEPLDLLKPGPRAVLQRLQSTSLNAPHAAAVSPQQAIPASGSAFVNIPPQAVSYLRANPGMKVAFDMKYGQGAADQALSQP